MAKFWGALLIFALNMYEMHEWKLSSYIEYNFTVWHKYCIVVFFNCNCLIKSCVRLCNYAYSIDYRTHRGCPTWKLSSYLPCAFLKTLYITYVLWQWQENLLRTGYCMGTSAALGTVTIIKFWTVGFEVFWAVTVQIRVAVMWYFVLLSVITSFVLKVLRLI
jgi:hypothetical protein